MCVCVCVCVCGVAVASLERALLAGQLETTIIGNLCSLYDVATEKSAEKKKQLLSLVFYLCLV